MKLDLKNLYKQKIIPSMIEEFRYKNIEQVPRIVKISVNRGVGEASKNSKELDASINEMALIVGQQPTINNNESQNRNEQQTLNITENQRKQLHDDPDDPFGHGTSLDNEDFG